MAGKLSAACACRSESFKDAILIKSIFRLREHDVQNDVILTIEL